MLLMSATFFLTEYVTAQHFVQRYCAASSLREARKGMIISVLVAMPTWAYLPSLDDGVATLPGYGQFEDLSGHEYEVGISVKPAPFVNLRAGYRVHSIDFNQTGMDPNLGFGTEMAGTAESSGFLAGLVFNF